MLESSDKNYMGPSSSTLHYRGSHRNQEAINTSMESLINHSKQSQVDEEHNIIRSRSFSILTHDLKNSHEAASKNMSNMQTAAIKEQSIPKAANDNIKRQHLGESCSAVNEFQKRSDCNRVHSKMWYNEMTVNPDSNKGQPVIQGTRWKYLSWTRLRMSDLIDVSIRMAMVIFFGHLESRPSFQRKIAIEQMWQYKYPRSPDIVTAHALLISVIFFPFLTTIAVYLLTGNRRDFRAASWAWTLALCLNGITTSLLKVTVGRPRPDFFARCFPDVVNMSTVLNNPQLYGTISGGVYAFNCTGNAHDVNEGYKSFPSGHSSFAFTSFGFVSIYIGSKLHAFTSRGRGETWRLFITVMPLVVAMLVAVSRTCDYHHHYEDVFIGGVIGCMSAYIAYRQYYPSICSHNAHICNPRGGDNRNSLNLFGSTNSSGYKHLPSTDEDDEALAAAAAAANDCSGGDRLRASENLNSDNGGCIVQHEADCTRNDGSGADKENDKWF